MGFFFDFLFIFQYKRANIGFVHLIPTYMHGR
jgi:hypothetical protein